MHTHRISDRDVSVIGLGTAHFGGRIPGGLAFDLMDAYVEAGGNLIDTARVYGDFVTPKTGESEKIVGRWMEERGMRENIFLSTKGGHPPFDRMDQRRLSPAEIRDDLMQSLEDLRCGCIDCYFLHRDDEDRPVGEIIDTLEELLAAGLIRMYGVSNWKTDRILEARSYADARGLTGIGANQPQFSLARPTAFSDPTLVRMDRAMHDMHCRLSLPCFCFSSQAEGYLSRVLSGSRIPEALEKTYGLKKNRDILEKLRAMEAQEGPDTDGICAAFLYCQPFPCFALCGTASPERVRSWRKLGNVSLSEEAVRDLNSLSL